MPYEPVSDVERVSAALRAELEPEPSGTRLPGIRSLADRFDVSPTTVTRALAVLRSDGLVVSRQGLGSYRA